MSPDVRPASSVAGLTPREQEMLHLVCEEALAHKEIAARMHISHSTAKAYGARILKRLDFHSTLEMVVWYWKQKLADQENYLTSHSH